MENKILILNMKMYMELKDIKEYISKVNVTNDNIILCPTAIYLPYFLKKYKNLAIQNIYAEDLGAYTGAISALQVSELGIKYAIVGHSECRNHFNETDELINKKIKSALDNGLKVILCIGDNLEQYKSLKTKEVLKQQLHKDLYNIESQNIIIAYEPIFSIGTGNVLDNEMISNIISFIKQELCDMNLDLPVVYGGSVNSDNIKELIKIKNVDGFMVGKSSSMIDEVLKMIKVVSS